MKHSCRLNKFQLLNHVFIPKIFPKANTVWNCRGNKNMLEDNPTSQESPYTPKGVLQVIEAAWVEDNIWNVNKSVTLSSKLELCEADIMWLNIFSNLKAVYFGMKHSCRLNKFQLLNHVFIPKIFPKANTVWNCRGNKNMLEDNPTSQESPYTPKGVLQVIEAAWVEDNIWNVNKSVTLSSKLELCEADIMWLNIFSNLKAVYFGMKHGCGLRKFRPGALFRAH